MGSLNKVVFLYNPQQSLLVGQLIFLLGGMNYSDAPPSTPQLLIPFPTILSSPFITMLHSIPSESLPSFPLLSSTPFLPCLHPCFYPRFVLSPGTAASRKAGPNTVTLIFLPPRSWHSPENVFLIYVSLILGCCYVRPFI